MPERRIGDEFIPPEDEFWEDVILSDAPAEGSEDEVM
jgi:hypothetical protein